MIVLERGEGGGVAREEKSCVSNGIEVKEGSVVAYNAEKRRIKKKAR